MLPPKDIYNFIKRRAKKDTPLAFMCRMLSFVVIAVHLPLRHLKLKMARRYHGIGYCSPIKVCEVMGSKMKLNLNDTGISHDLYLSKNREPYLTQMVQSEIKEGDVVIDIGANIGYYVLQECKLVGETGFVYAIEPVPDTVEMFNQSLELNPYKNVEVFTMAIGDHNHVNRINVAGMSNISTLKPTKNFRSYNQILPVVVRSLDYFIEGVGKQPTVLRMDVEGYEYEVIKGMTGLLESKQPLKVFMELHLEILGSDKIYELLTVLQQNGFKIKYAAYEPHPAIQTSKLACWVVDKLYRGMGTRVGFVNVTMDDLINNDIYRNGQIEYLEVMFERE